MSEKPDLMVVEISCDLYNEFLKWRALRGNVVEEAMAQNRTDMGVEFHSTDALVNHKLAPEFELKPEKGEDRIAGFDIEKAFCDECCESEEWNDCDEAISQLSENVYREKRINDALLQLIELLPTSK